MNDAAARGMKLLTILFNILKVQRDVVFVQFPTGSAGVANRRRCVDLADERCRRARTGPQMG